MSVPELMNTREVADYLRIKERKVYELLRNKQIPCTRVTGKWLFPRHLIDAWLNEGTTIPSPLTARTAPPPAVIAGSHDPLLEWAARDSGSGLALLATGSLDGLRRFTDGEAMVCALHVLDPGSGDYNTPVVEVLGAKAVLIEWAWRDQGLIVAPGNPKSIRTIEDLKAADVKVVPRQEGAGSRILLEHLLEGAGLSIGDLNVLDHPAGNETDLGQTILDGKADAGLGVRAAAQTFHLDFVPLHRERCDLLIRRRDYFEPPVQALLAFAGTPGFAARAAEMGGYDVGGTGRVVWNAP